VEKSVVDPASTRHVRKRLDPRERERQIVEGAIRFFAEVGFDGQTRELAKRLGITQPLLYRYFPSKEHLVERVYQEVYVNRWKSRWEHLIKDRSRPLEERLIELYRDYMQVVSRYEGVRIFMSAGLAGGELNRRYLAIVREKLLEPLCVEVRIAFDLPDPAVVPLTWEEVEMATALHGSIYYAGIRKWIYEFPYPPDLDGHIARVVRTYLKGAPPVLRDHFDQLGG
jgi:AcrR family transcriptional regulator